MNVGLSRGCLLAVALSVAAPLVAQEAPRVESPRWTYEIRAGYYVPDLDNFEVFYGDDKETYFSFTLSYRLNDWVEIGGELGQMRAKGVGILTSSQELGGNVTYRLNPVHVYSNFIYQRTPMQRVVPYAGLGVVVAAYDQEVEVQGSVKGRTDAGYSARIGLRVRVGTSGFEGRPPSERYWRSFMFAEAQQISAKVDDTELGGLTYLLGFRMEFDW